MTILVKDTGFHDDDWRMSHGNEFVTLEELDAGQARQPGMTTGLDIGGDIALESVRPHLGNLNLIRINFPNFADGRGFSLAKQLRLAGYEGRLRAAGHVLADQYPLARRVGFDEVEIDDALAARQPENQWLDRKPGSDNTYQQNLMKSRVA